MIPYHLNDGGDLLLIQGFFFPTANTATLLSLARHTELRIPLLVLQLASTRTTIHLTIAHAKTPLAIYQPLSISGRQPNSSSHIKHITPRLNSTSRICFSILEKETPHPLPFSALSLSKKGPVFETSHRNLFFCHRRNTRSLKARYVTLFINQSMRHLSVGRGIEDCVSQGEGWGAGVGWITSMATLLRTVDEALSPKDAQYTSTLHITSSPSPPP